MTPTTAAISTAGRDTSPSPLDIAQIRADFPILRQQVNGRPLVYLDNAATTQKPQVVIDALRQYYESGNANIHRAVYQLSMSATSAYEGVRTKVQRFINAERPEEIIFVRGATEAINLVAHSHGRAVLREGDEILISEMEHHSNIVPWQLLCEQSGAQLRVAPMNDDGELQLDAFEVLLGPRTRIVAVTLVSNALGTINPVGEIARLAHEQGAVVVVDAAQAAPHLRIDVQALNCDFLALSSHKMLGPTGVGVLYGKRDLLEGMPPYQGGGDMIKSVRFEETIYNDVPYKFEAGTPNIAGTIGLGAAIDYLNRVGLDRIAAYENELLAYATHVLSEIPAVRLVGTARHKTAVLSFVIDGVHAHDVGTILDQLGVAIRTGHHCAQPTMEHFGVPATARASLALYNTAAELDALAAGIAEVVKVFG